MESNDFATGSAASGCWRDCRIAVVLVVVSLSGMVPFHSQAGENGSQAALLAGTAKRSIVPPFPTRMAGFSDREAQFTGVDTPIYARALVFDSGATVVAIVTTDLLCVSREIVEPARVKICEKTGIPEENILICASHNHAGPAGFHRGSIVATSFDESVVAFLVKQIVESVVEARATVRPARVGFAYGRLAEVTRNRHQGNTTAIDPDVGVLRVEESDSRAVIATLFNFTGHPVILSAENLLISSEYPGVAARMIETTLGGMALFTQGACGDVTMLRNGSTFEEVERLGRILAAEVIKTAKMIKPSAAATLRNKFHRVELGRRSIPSAQAARAAYLAAKKMHADARSSGRDRATLKRLDRRRDDAKWAWRLAAFTEKHPASYEAAGHASTHVVQVGPLVMVGIPGELFVEYALEMKQRVRQSKNRPMILVGYANDYLGYIVTPHAKSTGGYEQSAARVDELAGRVLTEASMKLVESLVK